MEVISCHAANSCNIVDFRGVKNISPHRTKLPIVTERRLLCVVIDSTFSGHSHLDKLRSTRVDKSRSSRTLFSLNSYKHVNSSVVSESSNSYVLDGEEGGTRVAGSGRSIPKVSIPSLPDPDDVAPIRSVFREWKPKLTVHYEMSGSENVDSPPVLFLPGFGVGSFHYEKQLKDLGRDYRAWALDFLGQGMSLPCEDPTLRCNDGNKDVIDGESYVWGFGDESENWAKELVYSVDLWRDQIRYFVEEVF